jgi:hypothetical protein
LRLASIGPICSEPCPVKKRIRPCEIAVSEQPRTTLSRQSIYPYRWRQRTETLHFSMGHLFYFLHR